MKIGYSILLGEFIPAEEAGYEDCKNYQIVCPECKEPIFKSKRHLESKDVEYFSHFKAQVKEFQKCDLRVGSITKEHVNETNSKSRKQRLLHFLSRFSNVIYNSDMFNSVEEAKRMFHKHKKIKGLDFLFNYLILNLSNKNEIKDIFDYSYKTLINDMDKEGFYFNTELSQNIQKRISFDMWLMLNTIPQRKNLKLLFEHAFLMELKQVSADYNDPDFDFEAADQYVYEALGKIYLCKKEKEAQRLLQTIQNMVISGKSTLTVITLEIMKSMVETLMMIPYSKMLDEEYADSQVGVAYDSLTKDDKGNLHISDSEAEIKH